MDAEDVLNALMRGTLASRRKRWRRTGRAFSRRGSLLNARTLLAAAGVAWGLYDTWQREQGAAQASDRTAHAAPPKGPQAADDLGEPALRLVRLMISAARADGDLGLEERGRILEEARRAGAEALVARELAAPRPLDEILAGVGDPQLKARLYTLAYAIVRADEDVRGGERIYLAQLAHRLGLDAAAVARLEARAPGKG